MKNEECNMNNEQLRKKDEEYKYDYKNEDKYVHEYTYNNINMPILFAFINKLYAIICWL